MQFPAYSKRIRWCLRVWKPPVPIPNTVVKTYFSENTWRATAWEDNPMPAPNLKKKANLQVSKLVFSLGNHPPLAKQFTGLFCSTVYPLLAGPGNPATRKYYKIRQITTFFIGLYCLLIEYTDVL